MRSLSLFDSENSADCCRKIRRLLSMGLTRILGTYYSTCVTSAGRSVPSRPSVRVMRRVDFLLPGSMESMWRAEFPLDQVGYNAWAAVVGEEDGVRHFLHVVPRED